MKIKMKLSQSSIDDAIKQIERFKSQLNTKTQTFVSKLADKGLNVANVRFANAQYAGTNDVTCRVDADGSKATIIASGSAVAFIEFGTGVSHSEYGGTLPAGVGKHGTYGKGYGKRKKWGYYGDPGNAGTVIGESDKGTLVSTSGNEPAMAMWGAVEEMAAQVEATWREVWSDG